MAKNNYKEFISTYVAPDDEKLGYIKIIEKLKFYFFK